jgi:hypothetical protein
MAIRLSLLMCLGLVSSAGAQTLSAIDVDDALRAAGIPIVGVSIGREDDKRTWRVDFAAGATVQQRTAAAALITAFDATAPATRDAAIQRVAKAIAGSRSIRAFFLANFRLVNKRDPTPDETLAAHAAFTQAYTDVGP